MDDFLRKIQLSEYAIEIYLKALGKFSYSYYELSNIIPKASIEQFNDSLKELIDTGLLVQLPSGKDDRVVQYSVLPPILPILNYYENINANLPNIKNSIQELMVNSINKIFKGNDAVELDSILETFQEIKKDIDEDSIIQKQEVEDIVAGMEELKQVNKKITGLHQDIKGIVQTKFADLIKNINNIKTTLTENIKKKEILTLIEDLFKEKYDNIVLDFTTNLNELIEKKFDESFKPIEKITETIFQYRNDFKMLLLNMLTNFETNLNKIHEELKYNNDNLSTAIINVENKVIESLNTIIQNSINEVSGLNKPIEDVMKSYLQEISPTKTDLSNYVWIIHSVIRINETIQNLISNSKESLTIIIPHIENHIALEQFENISSNLKIRLTSSEAHTNSIVKSFKNITNVLYRNYQNENLIILKADDKQLFLGIIQESNNSLNDFIGIGTNSRPLIKQIDPLINSIWETAYSDTFHGVQVAKSEFSKTTPTKTLTTAKPIIKEDFQSGKIDKRPIIIEKYDKVASVKAPNQIQEVERDGDRVMKNQLKETVSSITPKPQLKDLKQKLKEKIDFVTEAQPKANDKAAVEIDSAFRTLIIKLNTIKGDEFSKELQNIADLILEKKGFSVTLHKIRSVINQFKDKLSLLDVNDKKDILEYIENWKQKLF